MALADPFADNLDPEKIKQYEPNYDDRGMLLYSTADEMISSGEVDVHLGSRCRRTSIGAKSNAPQRQVFAVFAEKPQTLFFDEALSQAEAIDTAGNPEYRRFSDEIPPGVQSDQRSSRGQMDRSDDDGCRRSSRRAWCETYSHRRARRAGKPDLDC